MIRMEKLLVSSDRFCAVTTVITPEAVHDLRHVLVEALQSWGMGAAADTAALLASETLANSVEHARPGTGPAEPCIELAAQLLGTGLRITVTDCDPAPPQARHATPGDEDGRGLLLLQVLADAWGTETHDHGKTVWFVLGV